MIEVGVRRQPARRTLHSVLNFILVVSWLSVLCSLPRRRRPLASCHQQHRGAGTRTGTALEAHPRSPHWTGPSQPTTAWTETRPVQGRSGATASENAPQDSFALALFFYPCLFLTCLWMMLRRKSGLRLRHRRCPRRRDWFRLFTWSWTWGGGRRGGPLILNRSKTVKKKYFCLKLDG